MPRVSPEGGARLPISVIENIDHRWSFDRKPWKLTNRPRDGRSNAYSNACSHDHPPMEEAGELVSEVATLYFRQQLDKEPIVDRLDITSTQFIWP